MVRSDVTRPQRTALGIGLILGSVLLMAFSDAVVKRVSADLTVWQVFAVRSAFAIPVICLLMRSARIGLRMRAPGWAILRSVLLVLTWLAFYASLPVLDLSVAAVAVYTNPIITALLSALLIGEPVTARRWVGVFLGFLGVVVILRPGSDAFSWFVLLPLLAAVLYSLAMVITRVKCQEEAPLGLALVLNLAFAITGLVAAALLAAIDLPTGLAAAHPFLFADRGMFGLEGMGLRDFAVMAGLAALSIVYFVGVARAYQVAEPSLVAVFDYAYLISAAFWGFVFFAERPDALTVAGMVLITAAGLTVASRRPRRRARR